MFAVFMVCVREMVVFSGFIRHIVMVEMKKTLSEEHDEEPSHQPQHYAIDGTKLVPGMGQHVEQSNSKHQAGDEADCDL